MGVGGWLLHDLGWRLRSLSIERTSVVRVATAAVIVHVVPLDSSDAEF